MTSLVITPNTDRKTLRFSGSIASGEKVSVRVKTFDDKAASGTHLRLRALFGRTTVAMFPAVATDAWSTDDGDATCVLNIDTVQAEKELKLGGPCLFVLDDAVADTLYGTGMHDVLPWPKEDGGDVPYDLSGYPDAVKEFGVRLTAAEADMSAAKTSAASAVGKANDAYAAASSAVVDATSAKADAASAKNDADTATAASLSAGESAIAASESAQAAQEAAQEAAGYIGQISDSKQDKLTQAQLAVVNAGIDATPTSGSSALVTSGGVKTAVDAKQDALSDEQLSVVNAGKTSAPRSGGTELITSGGVFASILALGEATQAKLTPGENISIVNNVISATGGEITKQAVVDTGLTASDIGALTQATADGRYLKKTGGDVGSINIKSEDGSPTLSVFGNASQANGSGGAIVAYDGAKHGGSILVYGGPISGGSITAYDGYDGSHASIKKGGKEVATEDQVTAARGLAAYPIASVTDGALKDRTINTSAGGTFTFPSRTGTNARDFVLSVEASATAPTVSFPATVSYVSDDSDVWTAEAGKTNVWYFSEVLEDVFMVSHKALDSVSQS